MAKCDQSKARVAREQEGTTMTPLNKMSMADALALLRSRGVPHRQLTAHQLKIGERISWYPATGTINLDTPTGSRRHPAKGLRALMQLIAELKDDL